MADSRVPREIEATLVIRSKRPRDVVNQIAGLTSIADYRLRFQDSQTIHDLYFDTDECALQDQKLALRLREMSTAWWVTFKGPSKQMDWGGVERLEIEAPWSQDSLARVAQELGESKIKVLQQHREFYDADPLKVMKRIGLNVFQDRKTRRQARDIISQEGGPMLAELAIDSVVYRLGDREVCHYEVEVEAKEKDGPAVLGAVVKSLAERFEPELQGWDHSKLAVGLAIREWLDAGALQGALDENNNLKPVAYDRIASGVD